MFRRLFFVYLFLILTGLISHAQEAEIYYPGESWRVTEPEAVGFSANFSRNIDYGIVKSELNSLRSLLVIKDGFLVYEHYRPGAENELQAVRSVTKSVTATLVGIALQRGDLTGIDMTLGDTIPDYFENEDANPDLQGITMRDLLMMRSGIEWTDTSFNVLRLRDDRQDVIAWILSLPLAAEPGSQWNYSSADSHLVSVMFQTLVGQSLNDYASTYLFEPLGIREWEWLDTGGYSSGGAELSLFTEDMARIGYLYAQGGIWNGEQLFSNEWLDLVTGSQEETSYYGYYWWVVTREDLPQPVYVAIGYGGQFIYVLPEQNLVIVATSDWILIDSAEITQSIATQNLIIDHIILALNNDL